MKYGLWAEYAQTATMLDNILVDESSNLCPYEKFYDEMPNMYPF